MVSDTNLNDYLHLPYTIEWTRTGAATWCTRVADLTGCRAEANSATATADQIQNTMHTWLVTALAQGRPIPEPQPAAGYSGKFIVRLPRTLHRKLATAAARAGVSLNQFVTVALAQAVSLVGR